LATEIPSVMPASRARSIPGSGLAEVDAAAELERGLEVVVDHELRGEIA
jgi:hypothetical protein